MVAAGMLTKENSRAKENATDSESDDDSDNSGSGSEESSGNENEQGSDSEIHDSSSTEDLDLESKNSDEEGEDISDENSEDNSDEESEDNSDEKIEDDEECEENSDEEIEENSDEEIEENSDEEVEDNSDEEGDAAAIKIIVEDTFNEDHCKSFLNDTLKIFSKRELPSAAKDLAGRLRHIARVHGLPKSFAKPLVVNASKNSVNLDTKLELARTLKYSCRHDKNFVLGQDIWDILSNEQCSDNERNDEGSVSLLTEFRSELVFALCSLDKIPSELNIKLGSIKNINARAKSEIGKLLSAEKGDNLRESEKGLKESGKSNDIYHDEIHNSKVLIGRQGRLKFQKLSASSSSQCHAVKAQQISTEKCHESSSEKEQLLNLSLTNALNSRNKSITQESRKNVQLPDESSSTSHQSWFNTTYNDVATMKNLASSTAISAVDQQYLFDKLSGWQVTWSFRTTINEMVAETFYLISGRQRMKLEHCTGLIDILSSRESQYNRSCKKFIVKMAQRCVSRDSSYFTKRNQNSLTDYMNYCNDDEVGQIIFDIFTSQSQGDSKFADLFAVAFGSLTDRKLDKERRLKAIQYISLQSLNSSRVEKLFDSKVKNKLIGIINDSNEDMKIRKQVGEIIENYLEHGKTSALDFDHLDDIASTALSINEKQFKQCLVRIILKNLMEKISAERIPENILKHLVKITMTADAAISVIILVGLKHLSCKVAIPRVELLAPKLLDISKISESDLKFDSKLNSEADSDDSGSEEDGKVCVSSIVAEILLQSKKLYWNGNYKKFMDSTDSFSYILQAIEKSKNKQTRILASEFLYRSSMEGEIPELYLNKLTQFMNDNVSDVRMYSLCTYARGVRLISAKHSGIPVASNTMDSLALIYAYEKIVFETKDYSTEINADILKTFECEAKKRNSVFTVKVFNLLGFLFSTETKQQNISQLVNILDHYCDSHNKIQSFSKIPENVLQGLEKVLSNSSENTKKAEKVFEKVILRGQSVSEKVLRRYFDRLFISALPDEDYKRTLKVIFAGNANQDFSDSLFSILKIELISLAYFSNNSGMIDSDVDKLWGLLSKSILHGNKLTATNFELLHGALSEEPSEFSRTLNCLTLASQNGQSIPNKILELIGEKDEQLWVVSDTLIKFCLSVLENNQSLPTQVHQSIANRFENAEIKDVELLLPLVVLPAKMGTKLRGKTVQKLCQMFDEHLKNQEILETMVASTKYVTRKTTKTRLCQSFLKVIFKNVSKFIPIVLGGLQKLVQNEQNLLSDNDINGLVELLHKLNEPESLSMLKSIVRTFELTPDQNRLMTICDIVELGNDSEFLCELSQFLNANQITNVPSSCFERLELILRGGDGKNVEKVVGTILSNNSIMTSNFPEKLSDSIGNLLVGNIKRNDDITRQCKEILCKLAGEIKFSQNLISILESNFEISGDVLKEIMDMDYKFNEQTRLIFNVTKLTSAKNDEELNALLDSISNQIKSGLKIRPESLNIILNLETESKHFYGIISMLVASREIQVDETVAKIISNSILEIDNMVLSSFHALKQILNNNSKFLTENFESYQKSLISKFKIAESFEIQMAILNCLVSISRIADDILEGTLEIFIANLQSEESAVRGLSFEALRHYRNDGNLCKEFDEFISKIINGIRADFDGLFLEEGLTEFEQNILETLVSIDTWDLKRLSSTEKHFWIRELIKSNFIAKVTSNPTEKLQLLTKLDQIFEIHLSENIQCKILKFLTTLVDFCDSLGKILSFMECICILDAPYLQNVMDNTEINDNFIIELKTLATVELLSKKTGFSHEVNYNLAKDFVKSVGFDFGQTILKNLKSVENMQSFRDIFNLSGKYGVKQLNFEKELSLDELKCKIEHKILMMTLRKNKLIYSSEEDNERLQGLVTALLNKGLNFEIIFRILTSTIEIKNNKNISTLETILELILNYDLNKSVSSEIVEKIRENKVQDWIENAVKLNVNNQKSKSGLKSIPEVINDLSKSLEENQDLLKLIRLAELDEKIQLIKSGSVPSIFNQLKKHGEIGKWEARRIGGWAQLVKKKFAALELKIDYEFSLEALCVAKRAFYLSTSFHLTNVQIIAILVGLNKGLKGQLQQVATGSGKSTIVAILAVINALRCNGVDIYTSSPVLAERDAKNWASFYSMFGLTCSHNGDEGNYVKGLKTCYNSDIVYGETSMFQFDYLRDRYSNLGTMGARKFHFAIVDEVDSMLVDDLSKLARLSSLLPGMDLFQILYHVTWHRLLNIEEKLFTVGNSVYFLEGKIGYDEDSVAYLEVADETGEINRVPNLLAFIHEGIDLDKVGITLVDNLDTFISDHLKQFLTALTTDEKIDGFPVSGESRIKIPKNLQYFVQNQIPKWVENAITALGYQENVHYIVDEGQIKPVDYNTTGIVQDSTAWSGGLHQFLQLKHGLKITSETTTTNFLSNLSLFQKYQFKFKVKEMEKFEFTEYNIIGFTGTLGSEHTRKVLTDLYHVNCVEMPLTHHKIYVQYPDALASHTSAWIQKITQSLRSETTKGRGVLVICETIKDAQQISKAVSSRCPGIPVKLYTQNNSNQEDQIERIQPGEVFIATNLAGRGTDIKTDDIEKFGGLHVILTFLANNVRVEEQAFGRTSRQGHLGSGQLICISNGGTSGTELRKIRDENQQAQLELFLENELPLVRAKDKCFEGFCKFLRKIRENLCRQAQDKESYGKWAWGLCKSAAGVDRTPTIFELNTMQAVEERWAMFLTQLDDRRIPLEQAWGYYKFFELKMKIECRKDRVIRSPFYHISIGNDFLIRDTKYNNQNSEAKKHFEAAIKLDPEFSTAAYAGLGFLLLRGSLNVVRDDQHEFNYRTKAIKHMEKALLLVQTEISNIVTAQTLFQVSGGAVDSGLFKQLTMKQTALNSYSNCIQNTIDVAKKSIRPIDIVANRESRKYQVGVPFGNKNSTFTFSDDTKQTCKNNCRKLSEEKFESFDIVFNNLTKSSDSGDKDQATTTISKIKTEKVEIQCKSVGFNNLLNIFLADQYVDQVTRDAAVVCINNWQSQATSLKLFSKTIKIDVDLITKDGVKTLISGGDSKKAVKSVQNLEESDFVNLVYRSGNETIFNTFKKVTMNLSICDLNFSDIPTALKSLTSYSINLSVRSPNSKFIENIKKLSCDDLDLRLIEACSDGTWKSEKRRISTLNSSALCSTATEIEFVNLTAEKVEQVAASCKDCLFDLKFVSFDRSNITMSELRKLKSIMRNCQISFPSPSEYSKIIPVLRSENLSFSVLVHDLSPKDLDKALESADLSQEEIQQSKQTMLNELFAVEWMPVTELWEFQLRGVLIMCEFNEKSPIPWFSIGCVVLIAGVQFAIGGVLIATGFGATVGMGLITEGAADLFTAYRAYANRQFSWEDYAKQKAISLAVSAVSMGWGKLKDAGKGLKVAVEGAKKEIGEKVGTAMLQASGSNLKTLAFKQIGVSVGEAAAREGLNALVDMASQLVIGEYKPQVAQTVEKRVLEKFCSKRKLKKLLAYFWALDKISNSQELNTKILAIVGDVTNPKSNFWTNQWNTVGLPLCQGILSSNQHVGGPFSIGLRIFGILNGLREISSVVDNVCNVIIEKLESENMTIVNILVTHCYMTIEDAQEIAKFIQLDKNDSIFKYSVDDIDTDMDVDIEDISVFFNQLNDLQLEFEMENVNMTIKSVSDSLSEHIINVADKQMRAPVTTFLVGKGVASLSHYVQANFVVSSKHDTEDVKASRGNVTVADQIDANARNYTTSYQQVDISRQIDEMSKDSNPNGKPSDQVAEKAKEIAKDAPADLATMSAMGKMLGVEIKFVDENYVPTAEDAGVKLVVFQEGVKDENGSIGIGHYKVMDSETGKCIDVKSDANNCGYAVIKHLTGSDQSIENLRGDTAKFMLNNADAYEKIINNENWIKDHDPANANKYLLVGGVDHTGTDENYSTPSRYQREITGEQEESSSTYSDELEPGVTKTDAKHLEKRMTNLVVAGAEMEHEGIDIKDGPSQFQDKRAKNSPDNKNALHAAHQVKGRIDEESDVLKKRLSKTDTVPKDVNLGIGQKIDKVQTGIFKDKTLKSIDYSNSNENNENNKEVMKEIQNRFEEPLEDRLKSQLDNPNTTERQRGLTLQALRIYKNPETHEKALKKAKKAYDRFKPPKQ